MLLVFPPQAPIFSPHLALFQIAGYLEGNGFYANVVDLNALFWEFILNDFCDSHKELHVDRAIETIVGKEDFYFIDKYRQAMAYISVALNTQKIKCGFKIGFFGAEYNFSEFSSSAIDKNIASIDAYMFPLYERFLDTKIRENRLVGISVSYASQMIPAISLCRFIRQCFPDVIILMGGSHVTSIYRELKKSVLNNYFDNLIAGMGEEVLLEMAKKYEKRRYSNERMMCASRLFAKWDNVQKYKYLSPELVIPIHFSEGCYWGKCSFCNHESLHGECYRITNIEKAYEYIKEVSVQTGSKYFTFVDSVLPVAWLEQLSERLVGEGIYWEACVRFERGSHDYSKLFRGGCRMLRFGLESGAQKNLERMNKGIDLFVAEKILKDCFEANICTFIFFFTGFPGETREEGMETVNFIKKNAKHISFANGGGLFYMAKNAPIHKNPEAFQVKLMIDEEHDIGLQIPYIASMGMDRAEAEKMARYQHFEIQKLYNKPNRIISQVYDIHDFLYAIHYGAKRLKELI